ncbi:hypothetical protein SORBI_3003G161950 [Sorghum bicolor]|uniref:Uncharacterized protein n=1 Tax=Sorghum bicolor TaxID=4558 RepID=A0A1W0VXJ5_SORBI|nr:hypothetical protein SORBI_3003G161950 [Sorghum bicolor]
MAAVPTPSPSHPSKPKEKRVCSSVLPLHISFRCRIPRILRMVLRQTMGIYCAMEITPVCVSPSL